MNYRNLLLMLQLYQSPQISLSSYCFAVFYFKWSRAFITIRVELQNAETGKGWGKRWREIEVGTWEAKKRGREQIVFKESRIVWNRKESNCFLFLKIKIKISNVENCVNFKSYLTRSHKVNKKSDFGFIIYTD